MLRQEKGITLIALVITIIILIILAAVSITAITGPNSLTDNAQLARCYEAYSTGKDLEMLAFSALNGKIMTNASIDSTYDARKKENAEVLLNQLKKDLDKDGFYFQLHEDPANAGQIDAIYILYVNTSVDQGKITAKTATEDAVPRYRTCIYSKIALEEQIATFTFDIPSADAQATTDNSMFKDKNNTAATVKVPAEATVAP